MHFHFLNKEGTKNGVLILSKINHHRALILRNVFNILSHRINRSISSKDKSSLPKLQEIIFKNLFKKKKSKYIKRV